MLQTKDLVKKAKGVDKYCSCGIISTWNGLNTNITYILQWKAKIADDVVGEFDRDLMNEIERAISLADGNTYDADSAVDGLRGWLAALADEEEGER